MKVGDKVRINIVAKEDTGELTIRPEMRSMHGETCVIDRVDNRDTGIVYHARGWFWDPDWLEPMYNNEPYQVPDYTDGFRIKRQSKALDNAIKDRAKELGFTPSHTFGHDKYSKRDNPYFVFLSNTYRIWTVGYYMELSHGHLPEVTLDEFFSEDFPTYQELTQEDNVLYYLGESPVKRKNWEEVEIGGQRISRALIASLKEVMSEVGDIYADNNVMLRVCTKEVYIDDLQLILEAWE